MDREAHHVGQVQNADSAGAESEDQTPLFEEGIDPQQSVGWQPGNDFHPKERVLAIDHFYIEKYRIVA